MVSKENKKKTEPYIDQTYMVGYTTNNYIYIYTHMVGYMNNETHWNTKNNYSNWLMLDWCWLI